MARKSALDDVSKQNRVIRAILDGKSDYEAAREIGTTYQSLWRYCKKDDDFRRRLERAKEKAAAIAGAVEGVATVASSGLLRDPTPASQVDRPPSKDAVIAADVMGVDADLVADVDEILSDDLIELSTRVDLTRPSARAYIEVCWRRFISDRRDAAVYGRLMEKVITGPTLLAQARRDEARARREVLEDQRSLEEVTSEPVSRAGMIVVEVPPNKARPHLSRSSSEVDDSVE